MGLSAQFGGRFGGRGRLLRSHMRCAEFNSLVADPASVTIYTSGAVQVRTNACVYWQPGASGKMGQPEVSRCGPLIVIAVNWINLAAEAALFRLRRFRNQSTHAA